MKLLHIVAYSAFLVLGFFLGVCFAEYIGESRFDSEFANLVGAFLGAALTVLGTIWAAHYQGTQRERSFARFVADSASAIRDEANVLVALVNKADYGDLRTHAGKIRKQIVSLKETFALFERNAPFSDVGNYDARVALFRLENEIKNNLRIFEKEENWLNKPTKAVVENSRGDLENAATAIHNACLEVGRKLSSGDQPLTAAEIARRIELLE